MCCHGQQELLVAFSQPKTVSVKRAAQFIGAKTKIASCVFFGALFKRKKQVGEDIDAEFRRIIDNHQMRGYATQLIDKRLPMFHMR